MYQEGIIFYTFEICDLKCSLVFQVKSLVLNGILMEHIDPESFVESKDVLEELDLNGNHLSSIPADALYPLKRLKSLYLHNNRIRRIGPNDILNLSNLLRLYLGNNLITEISANSFIGQINSLNSLNLQGNPIETLPTLHLRKINVLDLSRCSLGAMVLPLLSPGLESIYLSVYLRDNGLKFINSSVLSTVKYHTLDLSNNSLSIEVMCFGIWEDVDISSLNLHRNDLTKIPRECFRHLINLISLQLSVNQISDIEPNAFQGLVHLRILDLSDNNLKGITDGVFNGLQSLHYLYLSHNGLTHLSRSLLPLVNLQYLSAGYNLLHTLVSSWFPTNFITSGRLYILGTTLTCNCGLIWTQNTTLTIHVNPKISQCWNSTSNSTVQTLLMVDQESCKGDIIPALNLTTKAMAIADKDDKDDKRVYLPFYVPLAVGLPILVALIGFAYKLRHLSCSHSVNINQQPATVSHQTQM